MPTPHGRPERFFFVKTPLGNHHPDWAIVKEDQGSFLKLHLVRETKGQGTTNKVDLRSTEMLKIDCGKAHFEELGVDFTWMS